MLNRLSAVDFRLADEFGLRQLGNFLSHDRFDNLRLADRPFCSLRPFADGNMSNLRLIERLLQLLRSSSRSRSIYSMCHGLLLAGLLGHLVSL